MRLLNVEAPELKLKEFFGDNIPPYAILSHTWGDDEVTFQDLQHGRYKHKAGSIKIYHTCRQAKQDGLSWCWVDTCCIDKSSSAELSEAINSMFNWYARSKVCYAYLVDVSSHGQETTAGTAELALRPYDWMLRNRNMPIADLGSHLSVIGRMVRLSRWFTRGWTLQELIAPGLLRFFDSSWNYLGNRDSELRGLVSDCTNIDSTIMGNPRALRDLSIAKRMSWMATRQTTRAEDQAYCMLGIFGVHMPLLYGEEDMAFIRLQEELIRRYHDHSLLICAASSISFSRRILATSARMFAGSTRVENDHTFRENFPGSPYTLTNDGLRINLPLIRTNVEVQAYSGVVYLAVLGCRIGQSSIGLVLVRDTRSSHAEALDQIFYICKYDLSGHGIVAATEIGSAIVLMLGEIAITAKMHSILIAEPDHQFSKHQSDPSSGFCWLRYDLALQYDSASPGLVSEHTIAKNRPSVLPHMIQLHRSSVSEGLAVIKFVLTDNEDFAVAVLLPALHGSSTKRSGIQGMLAVIPANCAVDNDQFQDFANKLHAREDLDRMNTFAENVSCGNSVPRPFEREEVLEASTKVKDQIIELWYKTAVGALKHGQSIITLRIRDDQKPDLGRRRELSDGTSECCEQKDGERLISGFVR